jgi:hypothetical protein
MNPAKAQVLKLYRKAYRRKRDVFRLSEPTVLHEILARTKGGTLFILGEGTTPKAAWEAALAYCLAKELTQ